MLENFPHFESLLVKVEARTGSPASLGRHHMTRLCSPKVPAWESSFEWGVEASGPLGQQWYSFATLELFVVGQCHFVLLGGSCGVAWALLRKLTEQRGMGKEFKHSNS
jgi:hypothetical protein